jgi:hypothetical protein
MALVLPWLPFRTALVRALRDNLVLKDSLVVDGDWSEGAAPPGTGFPHGVYSQVFSVPDQDWTGELDLVAADVVCFSEDQGEAASLAQLVFTTLTTQRLAVTGLTNLSLMRSADINLTDVDASGNKKFMAGGTYVARFSQLRPAPRTLAITMNATIA